jgi:hypothetical protein
MPISASEIYEKQGIGKKKQDHFEQGFFSKSGFVRESLIINYKNIVTPNSSIITAK